MTMIEECLHRLLESQASRATDTEVNTLEQGCKKIYKQAYGAGKECVFANTRQSVNCREGMVRVKTEVIWPQNEKLLPQQQVARRDERGEKIVKIGAGAKKKCETNNGNKTM